MSLTRRQFLRRSAAAAALVNFPRVAASSVLGANEAIRVGIVGLGNRGGYHVDRFASQEGVAVAAVCDPDRERLAAAATKIKNKYKNDPAQYIDVRKMIAQAELDVVSVATMQYWHALPTIWACQAGRDVYVEKPLSHYIREGQLMVAAARKYKRLVQIGTQSRSTQAAIDTIRYIQGGQLGKIQYVTAYANKPRTSIGKRDTPLPIPASLDYDLWCGPADNGPIYRDRIQYDCSFTWDKGDGESCNQGVHEIDVARWLLNEPRCRGGRSTASAGSSSSTAFGDDAMRKIIYYDFPTAAPSFTRSTTCARPRGRTKSRRSAAPAPTSAPIAKEATRLSAAARCLTRAVRRSRVSGAARISSRTSSPPSAAAARKTSMPTFTRGIARRR